ncbi:hypothetical protein LXL04_020270 [Taraxacum kok-saghyz]
MATQEEILKKLEELINLQTQNTKELKGEIASLQAKQAVLEEGIAAQSQPKGTKQGSENSFDEEGEGKFGDSTDLGRGKGRGNVFGAGPDGKGTGPPFGFGRGRGTFGTAPFGSGKETGRISDSWRKTEVPPQSEPMWRKLEGPPFKINGSGASVEPPSKGWDEYEEGGYRGNRVPKFTKMEFPTYNGKDDPLAWLQKCEDFFEEQQTPPEAWVRQATFVLQDKSQAWYHNLRRMKGRLSWVEFSEDCRIRFGPPMSINPLGELTRLQQTGSVEDYCSEFEARLSRTTGVSPDQSIWHFCAGLKNIVRYEVEFARPTTLYYAMNLARQIELRITEAGQQLRILGTTASLTTRAAGNRT